MPGFPRFTSRRYFHRVRIALYGLLTGIATISFAEDIKVPGGVVDLQFATPPTPALHALVETWVRTSAHSVATYYGALPVHHVALRVTLTAGHDIAEGQTFGWNGALIKISLGRDVTKAELYADWVLTHEMIHTALPNVPERHHWLEEGLAVYIEPIARARAGNLTPAQAWGDLVENLPQGEPQKGDRGLDHTPTWGRTYYGGCMFCLRADVEIRRRTGNRRGLEHAVRAIIAAGGTIETSWPIERILATGDAATGVPVLRELYDEMKAAPDPFDLDKLWKQLGIIPHGHDITFDNSAPLAPIRKAITGG